MSISNLLRRFWPILVILGTGFVVYAFNLQNPLFWDDDDWIINNIFVHDITWHNIKFWFTHNTLAGVGLPSNYYRPFLFFTFALNYIVVGIKPLIWHLTSNIIHIANAVLIFVLIKKYFPRMVAFLVALIFVIHPLQTEAVTYISGRGDLLVLFFMMFALWLFVKSVPASSGDAQVGVRLPPGNSISKRRIWYIFGSVLSLVVALLSRETAIIFPFLLIVFYVSFLSGSRFLISVKRAFLVAIPYFVVVIVYGILRLTVLNFQNTLNFYTQANVYSESLAVRIYTFAGVLVNYVRLMIAPTGLHMERSTIVYTSPSQWPVWPVLIVLFGLIGWLIFLYRKGKIGDFKIWFFGIGWFFAGLAPVSGITPINAVMYEHWLYLPMIGLWFVAVFYLAKVFNYLKSRSLNTYYLILATALAVYLSFFGYQSIQRNILWGKPIDFFQDILKYEPQSARVNNNLGNLYFNQGDKTKALEYYRRSAESDDVFAQPHFNIGSILQSQGDLFGAIKEYERAIGVDPSFHYSYQNLVVIYAGQGNLAKAIEYIEILKKLRSNDPRVYYNAALIYLARNDRKSALENLNQGFQVVGRDSEAEQLIEDLIKRLK